MSEKYIRYCAKCDIVREVVWNKPVKCGGCGDIMQEKVLRKPDAMKFSINYKARMLNDIDGDALELHSDLTNQAIRYHYKKVDELILRNMPDDMLRDLFSRISDELIRRTL